MVTIAHHTQPTLIGLFNSPNGCNKLKRSKILKKKNISIYNNNIMGGVMEYYVRSTFYRYYQIISATYYNRQTKYHSNW